jgi:replicative DNA helicase
MELQEIQESNYIVFEPVIIGSLLISKEPQTLFEIYKRRLKPVMFSKENVNIYNILCSMLEVGEHIRVHTIIQKASESNLLITNQDITDYRVKAVETGIEKVIDSYVNQWYKYNLTKNGIEFSTNLTKGIDPIIAYNTMMMQNLELDEIKAEYTSTIKTLHEAATETIEGIEQRMNSKVKLSGYSWGIKRLDYMTGGAQKEGLYLLAGSGGDGKTTLALQFAEFQARYFEVDFYSLEMSVNQLTPKILSAKTRISRMQMLHANINEVELSSLKTITGTLLNSKLNIIDDIHELTALVSSIRIRVKKYGIKIVYIDNRTTIRHKMPKSNLDNTTIELTYVFKNLANELNIPIVLLVHKNKDSLGRAGSRRPVSSDVKYGGDIAADVIIFPYKTEANEEQSRGDDLKNGEIVITKNRLFGEEGFFACLFDKESDTTYEMSNSEMPIVDYCPYEEVETFEQVVNTKPQNVIINPVRQNENDIPF